MMDKSDKRKYEGKHRDPLGRSESPFKKTEPEILGVPLSEVVKAKKNARPEENS